MTLTVANIFRAQYRDAPFLYKMVSTKGSNSLTKDRYTNSNRRGIQLQGNTLEDFTIKAFIHPVSGLTYRQMKTRLIAALKVQEVGTFVHPVDGPLTNVAVESWVIDESQTELGAGSITINFCRGSDREFIAPIADIGTLADVRQARLAASEAFVTDFSDKTLVSLGRPESYFSLRDLLGEFGAAIDVVLEAVQTGTALSNEFNGVLSDFKSDIVRLISAPQQLGQAIANIIQGIKGTIAVTESALLAFGIETSLDALRNRAGSVATSISGTGANGLGAVGAYRKLFTFGEGFRQYAPVTADWQERQDTQDTIVQSVQALALASAYESLAETSDSVIKLSLLTESQRQLEAQYQKVAQYQTLAPEVLENIATLRAVAFRFSRDSRNTIYKLRQVNTVRRPMRALLYDYYGPNDFQELAILENDLQPDNFSAVSGAVNIFNVTEGF